MSLPLSLDKSPDLKFGSPLFRFTFEDYLLHFYGYEAFEVEDVEYYQKEFKNILFS